MKPTTLAFLNLTRSPFAALTGILALGMTLGMSGWIYRYHQSVFSGLTRTEPGIEYVVGPKSNGLAVLLDGLFFAGRNHDIFDYMLALSLRKDLDDVMIIPLAHFAEYQGFPMIATDQHFINRLHNRPSPQLAEGRWFEDGVAPELLGDEYWQEAMEAGLMKTRQINEAVLGNEVARQTGLTVGSTIRGTYRALDGHTNELVVVGILQPDNLPRDRGIYVSLAHAWQCHQKGFQIGVFRSVRGQLGVNSFWIGLNPAMPVQDTQLWQMVHVAANPQMVKVETEMDTLTLLLGHTGHGALVLFILLTLLAMTCTTLLFSERSETLKQELGLFRALGYSRPQIASMVIMESLMLAIGGISTGLVLERLLTFGTQWVWNPAWLISPNWLCSGIMMFSGAVLLAALCSTIIPLLRLYAWDAHNALKAL